MESVQLRAELFREMNPMLDSEVMLRKMLAFVRTLFATEHSQTEVQPPKKKYKKLAVSPDIEKWRGCASFSNEEMASDPRLKAILSR